MRAGGKHGTPQHREWLEALDVYLKIEREKDEEDQIDGWRIVRSSAYELRR